MKKETIQETQKLELIEEQGCFYEKYKGMTPIAGRIFALLRINSRGTSFEEIVNVLKASKSTVSVNLKQLEQEGRIDYTTKPGDRKRYFKVSSNHYLSSLEKELVKLRAEQELDSKIISFKEMANTQIDNDEEKYRLPPNPSPYQEYLNKSQELLHTLKSHIETHYAKAQKEHQE